MIPIVMTLHINTYKIARYAPELTRVGGHRGLNILRKDVIQKALLSRRLARFPLCFNVRLGLARPRH